MSSSKKESSESSSLSATKIPAGLETVYTLEKENVKSSLHVLILAVHWSIVRAGLRIPVNNCTDQSGSSSPGSSRNNDKRYTERLPTGWSNGVTDAPTAVYTYDYGDPLNPEVSYQVKVIEIVPDMTAVATVYRRGPVASSSSGSQNPVSGSSSSDDEHKTAASTFQLSSFIRYDHDKAARDQMSAEGIFHNAEELEKQIWSELMEPLGLKVIGLPPFQGPYEDKVKTETKTVVEREPSQRPPPLYHDDPLRDDRFIPRGPLPGLGPGLPRPGPPLAGPAGGFNPLFGPAGGLGRNDLDPLGGFGAGMIADPRGFRTPRIGPGRLPPGAVPPGARFDPFGPPNPNPMPGGQGPNWAVPNPDEPPPPGFDDMFM